MTQKRCVAEKFNNEISGKPQPQWITIPRVQSMIAAVTRRNLVRAAGKTAGLDALGARKAAVTQCFPAPADAPTDGRVMGRICRIYSASAWQKLSAYGGMGRRFSHWMAYRSRSGLRR